MDPVPFSVYASHVMLFHEQCKHFWKQLPLVFHCLMINHMLYLQMQPFVISVSLCSRVVYWLQYLVSLLKFGATFCYF